MSYKNFCFNYNKNHIVCTNNTNDFLMICDKLKEVKDTFLTPSSLYHILVGGTINNTAFAFIHKDNKLNGCMVVMIQNNINREKVIGGLLLWVDSHYPKLSLDFMKVTDEMAREFGIRKIMFTTTRNPEAVIRKLGKYGYKKAYHVIEKEVI